MAVARLRQALPLTQRCTYFQTGSLGPTPAPALDEMAQARAELQWRGPAALDLLRKWLQRGETARSGLAALLGVTPDNIAWTVNTSQGIRDVVRGLGWAAGDEILTSDLEHVGTRGLWEGLTQAFGVRVRVVAAGATDDGFLERLRRAYSPRTRLLFLSHVSCVNGQRLPIAQAIADARERGVLTAMDGAQAVGQFAVNVAELGADFYIGSAHKWLLGPMGLGYVVVAPSALTSFNPALTPLDPAPDAVPLSAARRAEVGTTDVSLRVGLARTLELLAEVGWDVLEDQMRQATACLRAGLAELPGVQTLAPLPWLHSSAITSFVVQGWDAARHQALVDELYATERIIIKFQPEFAGIRVSTAGFNTQDDVDHLLTALRPRLP